MGWFSLSPMGMGLRWLSTSNGGSHAHSRFDLASLVSSRVLLLLLPPLHAHALVQCKIAAVLMPHAMPASSASQVMVMAILTIRGIARLLLRPSGNRLKCVSALDCFTGVHALTCYGIRPFSPFYPTPQKYREYYSIAHTHNYS